MARYLSAENVIYTFDADMEPVIEVASGEELIIEARDAYDRFFPSGTMAEYIERRGELLTNPATGPIALTGAEPGDGLSITIRSLELADQGYVAVTPGLGLLGELVDEPRLVTFEVREDRLWLDDAVPLPLRPMVGVIGVAPAASSIPCMELGSHGGNLDLDMVAEGTTVHLPVHQTGGLLALGDCHASMGRGEAHSGVNIDATVQVKVERVRGARWEGPWLETADALITVGVAADLTAALERAGAALVRLVSERLDLQREQAVALVGAAADLRLGQAGGYGVNVSAYATLPREVFS